MPDAIIWMGPKSPWPSVFSYQAILWSSIEAEIKSTSPSPSTSVAQIDDTREIYVDINIAKAQAKRLSKRFPNTEFKIETTKLDEEILA